MIEFPVLGVRMVPAERVIANDYNPNKVATEEMRLLIKSIEADGVTQPIVTMYDPQRDKFVVVDGFHRYLVLTKHLNCASVPIVTIDKDIRSRMASTIRHNRARGKHQVDLMAELVAKLLRLGWSDIEIAGHLGMEAEEVLRLKQQTGYAELFKERSFSMSWEEVEDVDSLRSPRR